MVKNDNLIDEIINEARKQLAKEMDKKVLDILNGYGTVSEEEYLAMIPDEVKI